MRAINLQLKNVRDIDINWSGSKDIYGSTRCRYLIFYLNCQWDGQIIGFFYLHLMCVMRKFLMLAKVSGVGHCDYVANIGDSALTPKFI
jgi:hypothetical protein